MDVVSNDLVVRASVFQDTQIHKMSLGDGHRDVLTDKRTSWNSQYLELMHLQSLVSKGKKKE